MSEYTLRDILEYTNENTKLIMSRLTPYHTTNILRQHIAAAMRLNYYVTPHIFRNILN